MISKSFNDLHHSNNDNAINGLYANNNINSFINNKIVGDDEVSINLSIN